jgi:hypothetical protein
MNNNRRKKTARRNDRPETKESKTLQGKPSNHDLYITGTPGAMPRHN